MPVTSTPADRVSRAANGRPYLLPDSDHHSDAASSRQRVYAGSNEDPSRASTSRSNPWVAWQLPADWEPKHTGNAESKGRSFAVSTLPAVEHEGALKKLLDRKTSRSVDVELAAAYTDTFDSRWACAPEQVLPGGSRRAAVVIDTESCNARERVLDKGTNTLASLAVVDFLTGETLIDVAVLPDEPVVEWIWYTNGITPPFFDKACRVGNVVQGVKGAQELLFQYVDKETVIVAHAYENERKSLFLHHHEFYDTQAWNARQGLPKALRKASPVPCQLGPHSALEDTLATRELAWKQMELGRYQLADGLEREAEEKLCSEISGLGMSDAGSSRNVYSGSNVSSSNEPAYSSTTESSESFVETQGGADQEPVWEESGWQRVSRRHRSRKDIW